MIELAFVVCLAVDALQCEDRSLLYHDVGPMTCMLQGQAQVAEWNKANPKWRLVRWQCRPMNHTAKKI